MNLFSMLAYIDPMSGAIVLQLIMAFIAGAVAFFRTTIFGAFKKMFGGSQKESSN